MPRSEKRKDLMGNAYIVYLDDDGNEIGRSKTAARLFGDDVEENFDSSCKHVSTSEKEEQLFGERRTVTRSTSGDVVSVTETEKHLFGGDNLVTKNREGKIISRTYTRTRLFGGPYRETVNEDPDDSSDEWIGALIKLGLGIALICFAIWLIMMAVAITVMMSPIWLGTVAFSAIAGYFFSAHTFSRLSSESLKGLGLRQLTRGKKTRMGLSPEFFEKNVTFFPDLLFIICGSLAFSIGMAAWPFLVTVDDLTRALLGGAVIVGVIVGTIVGRRVLCWQLENLVCRRMFEGNEAPVLNEPKIAVGLAIPVAAVMIGVWSYFLYTSRESINLGRTFGGSNAPVTQKAGVSHPQITQSHSTPYPAPFSPRLPVSTRTPSVSVLEPPRTEPKHITGETEESARQFIQVHMHDEATRNLERIVSAYSDQVLYGTNGVVGRDFIKRDKSDYFARWSSASEEIISPIEISRQRDNWTAKFRTSFRVENALNRSLIQGVQESVFALRYVNNQFKIVSESVNVLQKDKRMPDAGPVFSNSNGGVQVDRMVGERYPETRTRILTASEISNFQPDAVRYAINEMYARRGADFKKPELRRQFTQFAWYRPRSGVTAGQTEISFSPVELANVKLLGQLRDSRKSSASIAGIATPGLVQSPEKQAVVASPEGPRFNGRGHIYKVPDLKSLVGKKLEDAWLYGDFLLKGAEGNTAYFIATAIFILPKEGTTQMQVEFPGGIALSQNVVNTLRDPMLVIPVSYWAKDPIQLLSVSRMSDGKLLVKARARGALRL